MFFTFLHGEDNNDQTSILTNITHSAPPFQETRQWKVSMQKLADTKDETGGVGGHRAEKSRMFGGRTENKIASWGPRDMDGTANPGASFPPTIM